MRSLRTVNNCLLIDSAVIMERRQVANKSIVDKTFTCSTLEWIVLDTDLEWQRLLLALPRRSFGAPTGREVPCSGGGLHGPTSQTPSSLTPCGCDLPHYTPPSSQDYVWLTTIAFHSCFELAYVHCHSNFLSVNLIIVSGTWKNLAF